MKDMEVKLIVDKHPAVFENRINLYLKELEEKGKKYTLSYAVCPWRSEGQGGVEFSALICFGLES